MVGTIKKVWWLILVTGLTTLAIIFAIALFEHMKLAPGPVPANIRATVDFPIYYPDPQQLPTGYRLDTSSFHANGQVVLYNVTYSGGQKLIFSIQVKPSSEELATFNNRYIPIHKQLSTPVGLATVGDIGSQTVVSIPTTSQSWILITGTPGLYADAHLPQLLQSLKQAAR